MSGTAASSTGEELRERFFAATEYHALPGGRKKLDYLFALVRRLQAARPELRVLDVGCGNGSLSFPMAAIGCRVLGVDVNAASIERDRAANRFPNARFAAVPGASFELGERFDLIVCSEVLEHLEEPQPLVVTIARHLEPDGLALITVPNGWGPREILGRAEIFLRRRAGLGRVIDPLRRAVGMMDHETKCAVHTSNPEQDHVQKFTLGQIDRLLLAAGLVRTETVNTIFIFGVIFSRSPAIDRLDGRFADLLPKAGASGWYFLCRKAA